MNEKIAQKILIEEIIRIVELSTLDKAEDIAQQAHLGQKRKGGKKSPYIIHPKRVQLLARALNYGLDVQVVAILHDVIEDAENTEYYENLIKSSFGKDIYSTIKLLSHDKNVQYDEYLKKLASARFEITKRAFKVKMLDMLDNLTDAPTEKQKEKYRNAIQVLIDTNVAQDVPERILKLLGIQALTEAPKDKVKPDKAPKDAPEPEGDAGDKGKPEDTSAGGAPGKDMPPQDAGQEPPQDAGAPDSAGGPKAGGPDGAPDAGEPDAGGAGGDIFGDEAPMGDEGGEPDAGGDAKNSIVQYNDKLKQTKIINKQKSEPEPGFDFSNDNEFYRDNYISVTNHGSLLIGVPSVIDNNADKDFIKTAIIPKIIKVAYEAMKNGKDVVLMGDYGLPYYDGKYSNNTSGIIAKVLNSKFKNTILFDTWNPQDYYGFISNTSVWKELKKRTEAENVEIKSALYLFLLATNRDKKVLDKLKTDNVLEAISKWGLSQNNLEMEEHEDEIYRVIFPDRYSSPETQASYIIKMYLQLLRVDMLKKVIRYEKEGKAVIVPTDVNTSWILNKSFKDLQKLQQPKEKPEPPAEKPEDKSQTKGNEKAEPVGKSGKPAEEPKNPEVKNTGKPK